MIQIFGQFGLFRFIGFPLSSQVFDDTKLRPRYRQWTRLKKVYTISLKNAIEIFIGLQSRKSCGTLY